MSRIGKLPISIPTNTTVQIVDSLVTISGPKGNQELRLLPGISASLDTTTNQLVVRRANDLASNRANHGLMRSLLANIVTGVSVGFSFCQQIYFNRRTG